MDAPRVRKSVRAAEREVPLRALVVAAEALVDVARPRGLRRHRVERGVRRIDEHAPVVVKGRRDGGILVVRIGRVLRVADELPHPHVRPVAGVERLAGEPRLHRLDVGDRILEPDAALELRLGEADVVPVERLAPVALDDDVVDARHLRVHLRVARAEVHHDRRIAFAALRRVRVGDRGADARSFRELHGHVPDRLRHPRHVGRGVAPAHRENRRLAVPALREVHVDAVDVHLVAVPEVDHRVVDGVGTRLRGGERIPGHHLDVADDRRDVALHVQEERNVRRRSVPADCLRHVHDVALDALRRVVREVERVVLPVVRPRRRVHPHVLDVQHVREVHVDAVGVLRVPGDRMVDRAVGDVHHPRVVDVHVGLAPTRGQLARVRGRLEVDPLRAELAMLERVAPDVVRRVVELEDVVVGVDRVPEEVHAVQQEVLDVGKLERSAGDRGLHVRVLRGVRPPRRPRLARHEFPHRVRGHRHPHDEDVGEVVVRPVRNDTRRGLGGAPDDVAGVVHELRRRRGKVLLRLGGSRAVAIRPPRGIDVDHIEVNV